MAFRSLESLGKAVHPMPGPSSFTPRPISRSIPRKRFTAEQANQTLPLVKRVVADIVAMHDQALDLQEKLESSRDTKNAPAVQSRLDAAMDRLKDLVDELSGIGCELKDYPDRPDRLHRAASGSGYLSLLEIGRGEDRLLA